MQQAGAIVAEAHALLAEHVRPGATTAELDRLVDEFIRRAAVSRPSSAIQGRIRIRRRSARRETTSSSTDPGRQRVGKETCSTWMWVSRTRGSSAIRLHVQGRRGGRRGRAASRSCEAALWAGIEKARRARTCPTSRTRSRRPRRTPVPCCPLARGPRRGPGMHEDPQIPNFGDPGHGPSLAPE